MFCTTLFISANFTYNVDAIYRGGSGYNAYLNGEKSELKPGFLIPSGSEVFVNSSYDEVNQNDIVYNISGCDFFIFSNQIEGIVPLMPNGKTTCVRLYDRCATLNVIEDGSRNIDYVGNDRYASIYLATYYENSTNENKYMKFYEIMDSNISVTIKEYDLTQKCIPSYSFIIIGTIAVAFEFFLGIHLLKKFKWTDINLSSNLEECFDTSDCFYKVRDEFIFEGIKCCKKSNVENGLSSDGEEKEDKN